MKIRGQDTGYLDGVRGQDFTINFPEDLIIAFQKEQFEDGYKIGYKLGKDWHDAHIKRKKGKHRLI